MRGTPFLKACRPKICCDALSSTGTPKYGCILNVKDLPRNDVKAKYTLGYTIVGEELEFRSLKIPAKPQDLEFGKKFVLVGERLLAEGKVKPHRKEIRPGGLDAIFEGLEDLKQGKVSGTKLVYRLSTEQGIMAVQ